jgi:hypothetical protein
MHIHQSSRYHHTPVLERPQTKIGQYTYLYIAPTDSCGLGLFTARPIAANSIALHVRDPQYLAHARPYAQLLLRGLTHADIFQVGHDLFLPPYGGLDDFTNHSCDPNCGLRVDSSGFDMVALRDISAREELTYDYSTHQEHPQEDMTCQCGASSCRGVVRSFSTLPDRLRRRYLDLGIVAAFIAGSEERAIPRQ